MTDQDHIIFIVDDDIRIREGLSELLESYGRHSVCFGSLSEYVAFPRPTLPACLVLDVELPDVNGLDFQKQIANERHPPIVFITGHGDVPSSVRAMKLGAVDFLTKPFSDNALMDAVDAAIGQDRISRLDEDQLQELQRRFSALTPREREVLPLVVSGLLNKQAAAELGITEITLQIHRSKIMHKMRAASLPDLVRSAQRLQIPLVQSRRTGNS